MPDSRGNSQRAIISAASSIRSDIEEWKHAEHVVSKYSRARDTIAPNDAIKNVRDKNLML